MPAPRRSPSFTVRPVRQRRGAPRSSPATSTGATNGPTEAVNLVVKELVRVANGFLSFANFRLRVLLHVGVEWHTPPAHESEAAPPAWSRRPLASNYVSRCRRSLLATRR